MTRLLREVRRVVVGTATCRAPGVVAVSGGADSVALVCALAVCRTGPLTVAHVNHQLRGSDSDADEAFVRELCVTKGIACRVLTVDVAARGGNLEAVARQVRYEFFATLAADVGAKWIATGHTADDQAETVLHRIIRGTGIQGLRGIASGRVTGVNPATRENEEAAREEVEVVRPLLAVTRSDVLAHLSELQQAFRQDASNADPKFTRNRIRHELLPLLRTFNPDVVRALVRLAEHASDAHDIITAKAGEVLAKAERPRVGSTIILDAMDLGTSGAVIRTVLRLVWEREGWPLDQMDASAWDRACDIAGRAVPAWDFPGGIRMRVMGRVVQIGPRE